VRSHLFLSGLVLGILGGAIAGRAQQPVAGAGTAAESHDADTPFTDEIVVTGAIEPGERRAAPAAIDRIDRLEIERRQAREVAQVLEVGAGLTVARSGSAGHTTSLFARGTNSNHTLVLWNGLPLNDSFDGRFDFAVLPTDGVDRVEVARGAYSALYGSALGAVVQIVTGGDSGTGAHLEAGDNDTRRFSASYGRRRGPQAFDATLHSRRGEGALVNDFFDADGLSLHGVWAISDRVDIGLVGRGQDSEVGIPRSGSTFTPHRRNTFEDRQLGIPIRATFGAWDIDALVSRGESQVGFRDPDAFFGQASDSESITTQARATLTRSLAGGWIAGGIEMRQEEVDYRDDFSRIPDAERDNDAAFLQTRWLTTWGAAGASSFTVEAGARRDDDERFGGHTSPRLAAAFERSGLRFHAAYGESFRAPSFLELYYPFFGNPDLDPELAKSAEVGVGYRARGLELSLVGYDNRIRDLIQGVPPDFLAANVGRARTRGVEFTALHRGPLLDVRAQWTEGSAENRDTGAALARRPDTTASAVVAFHPARWSGTLTAVHVGERPDIDPDTFASRTNPSYTRVDLAASYAWLAWLEPYARVENVADEDYDEVLGFPATGRSYTVGVALHFR
jgi:vitamin B12 transporter